MLLYSEAVDSYRGALSPDDFYIGANAAAFASAVKVADKGDEVNAITLSAQMRADWGQKFEAWGGVVWISDMADALVHTTNHSYYSDLVTDYRRLRQLIGVLGQAKEQAYRTTEPNEVIAAAEKAIFEIRKAETTGLVPMVEVASKTAEWVEALMAGAIDLIKFQIPELDAAVRLRKKNLVIIAGRPGSGKTTLACDLLRSVAKGGGGVLVFSLEMGEEELFLKLACAEARVDMDKVLDDTQASGEDSVKVAQAIIELSDLPVWIDDSGDMDIHRLKARARAKVQEMRAKDDEPDVELIVIDYLQLLSAPAGDKKSDRRVVIEEASRGLKTLAKELDVPVVALAQLNRAVDTRTNLPEPVLSDLRDSGSIEQDADTILFIHRPEDEFGNRSTETLIKIGKQRFGKTGRVSVAFNGAHQKFESVGQPFDWASHGGG